MPLSPLAALKRDEWAKMIDVNIHGVLNGIAAVLPRFMAQKSGHIVNVASSVTVTDNIISVTRLGATAIGLYANNSSLMISGNEVSAFGHTDYAAYLVASPGDTMTILPGSSGNVFVQGSCGTIGAGSFVGSLSYTKDGIPATCP